MPQNENIALYLTGKFSKMICNVVGLVIISGIFVIYKPYGFTVVYHIRKQQIIMTEYNWVVYVFQ